MTRSVMQLNNQSFSLAFPTKETNLMTAKRGDFDIGVGNLLVNKHGSIIVIKIYLFRQMLKVEVSSIVVCA